MFLFRFLSLEIYQKIRRETCDEISHQAICVKRPAMNMFEALVRRENGVTFGMVLVRTLNNQPHIHLI